MLVLITLAVFGPVTQHEFTNYDDNVYITENDHVKSGFHADSIVWAFGRVNAERTYYHPLTWLSHMLDCQLFGMNAGAHHFENVLFHAANVLLLFLLLRRMTGSLWRSALVAALFAWHPLQVETVAWASERKNVLSTLFWLLTTMSYVRYAERPGGWRYAPVMLFLALGLLSKPMLVTLPFSLLLLDFWPLRRMQWFKNTAIDETGEPRFSKAPIGRCHSHRAPSRCWHCTDWRSIRTS